MIPASFRDKFTAFMQRVCKRNCLMYIPWAMTTKICIFAVHTHAHRANLLYLFPALLKLFFATLVEVEKPRTVTSFPRSQVGTNEVMWFFQNLRCLFVIIPDVFLTRNEVEDWSRVVIDFLLEAKDLLAPFNLVEALHCTLMARRQAVCAWQNRHKNELEADPTSGRIGMRPGLMDIVNK